MLLPTQAHITANFKKGTYPISFNNFFLLMDSTNGEKEPLSSVQKITTDAEKVVQILDDAYQLLEQRAMKI